MSFSFSIYLGNSYHGKQIQLIFIVHNFKSLREYMDKAEEKKGKIQLSS